MIDVIVYMGGSCGDLAAALIDNADCQVNSEHGTMNMTYIRQALKKPHQFASDLEKDQYLKNSSLIYLSVPSHDLDYHVRNHHRFLAITVKTPSLAYWAAQRFQKSLLPHTWTKICDSYHIKTVDDYASLMLNYSKMIVNRTLFIIDLEDIVAGNAVDIIEKKSCNGVCDGARHLYREWLAMIDK